MVVLEGEEGNSSLTLNNEDSVSTCLRLLDDLGTGIEVVVVLVVVETGLEEVEVGLMVAVVMETEEEDGRCWFIS